MCDLTLSIQTRCSLVSLGRFRERQHMTCVYREERRRQSVRLDRAWEDTLTHLLIFLSPHITHRIYTNGVRFILSKFRVYCTENRTSSLTKIENSEVLRSKFAICCSKSKFEIRNKRIERESFWPYALANRTYLYIPEKIQNQNLVGFWTRRDVDNWEIHSSTQINFYTLNFRLLDFFESRKCICFCFVWFCKSFQKINNDFGEHLNVNGKKKIENIKLTADRYDLW